MIPKTNHTCLVINGLVTDKGSLTNMRKKMKALRAKNPKGSGQYYSIWNSPKAVIGDFIEAARNYGND